MPSELPRRQGQLFGDGLRAFWRRFGLGFRRIAEHQWWRLTSFATPSAGRLCRRDEEAELCSWALQQPPQFLRLVNKTLQKR
mmetsp:Transcript_16524/g.42057  ORF Transcript_16524/g.42057 Transcript_16524/m.42057 type:complete len:82 (+) Transcript_16524:771-1016(+)